LRKLLSIAAKPLSLLACVIALVACGGSNEADSGKDVLVKVGKAKLTVSDLRSEIPGGLNAEDSVKYARAFIRNWIDSKLIAEVAAHEIDMTDIDRMVNDYRTQLIRQQYSRQMFEATQSGKITADTINAFYEEHKNEFKLERPLVKGVYLKVPEDAHNLTTIRRLYKSTKTADIDKLEKEVLTTAIHYDYFRDHWIDWEQVELRIPYDFGASGDSYLRSNRNLEMRKDGFVYLLLITDYLSTGSPMPLEIATAQIKQRLETRMQAAYETNLTQELYERALSKHQLTVNCDLE
jgi:hypothetical protein